jgi:hypothetical protein
MMAARRSPHRSRSGSHRPDDVGRAARLYVVAILADPSMRVVAITLMTNLIIAVVEAIVGHPIITPVARVTLDFLLIGSVSATVVRQIRDAFRLRW